MANQWLRLWHDMPNDPKWRTVARISKQPISAVKAVYLHLLVDASQNKDRGTVAISPEDLASALDVGEEDIRSILESMQGRVLEGQRLSGWQQRQPALESGGDGNSKSYGSNYVYYVACSSNNLVKIGVSRNPWSRLKDLQTASGSQYEMLASIKTEMRSEVEVHKLFATSRVRGEWFKCTEALLRVVDALKNKEVEDYPAMLALISELPESMFTTTVATTVDAQVSTVATKDKDEDEEEIKKEQETAPAELANSPKSGEPPPPFDGNNSQILNGKAVVALAPHWELPESWGVDAESLGWEPREVLFEAEKFRQYWTAGKGTGKRRAVKGWRQAWSNWLGKAAERKI